MRRLIRSRRAAGLLLLPVLAAPACAFGGEFTTGDAQWAYGVLAGAGYFNFRNSLYADRQPDPPGDLSEDWSELYAKPWITMSVPLGAGELFGKASVAYVRTGDEAADVSGGTADSFDPDDLYLGWRRGSEETGLFEVAGGRYTYQVANGFILSDGYADGGSRGGIWSNARKAWAPGFLARYVNPSHRLEAFYVDRDERPESDTETEITGVNYEWSPGGTDLTLGASFLALEANEFAAQRDGASVWNLRLYGRPFAAPLDIEAEWVKEDNGRALDSAAWYVQPQWSWEGADWPTTLYYRFAHFEGDDPGTATNEAFDPLFPAFHDWGSWWQGEIAGEYFISNSNLDTHMLRVHTSPTATIGTGLIWFDYSIDQPATYEGGVSSDDLGSEINWYMDWQLTAWMNVSFVLARANPGRAVEEAFDRRTDFRYGMVYLGFSF